MEGFHENATPFYLKGNEEGCLLIHGFTGTPAYMHRLGKHLNSQGYTVNNLLLKGHGTTPEDMEQTRWQDWVSSVEEGYRILKKDCKKVYVIGLSMGGLLALYLAQQGKVDKVVSIATPIRIYDPLARFTPLLKYFKRFKGRKRTSSGMTNKWVKPFCYDVIPLRSVHELLKLMGHVEARLLSITCSTLIIQPLLDRTVKPISAKMIYDKISSLDKELLWLEKSRHTCTMGPEEKILFDTVISFLS